MDTLHRDALQQLGQLLNAQIPAPPPNAACALSLHPKRIAPLGVGYFVRVNAIALWLLDRTHSNNG